MPDVLVNLPELSYTIRIEPGILSRVGSELRQHSKSAKAIIVTDTNVGPLYLATVEQSLQSVGIEPIIATLPTGEQFKTLESLLPIYDTILSARVERTTPLLALGGGIVGDMAGFVAATVLRGIPFIQIPTTLLAMVDSSVGGKTGVNHAVGKNLIGAFNHPIAVLADPQVLTTLPRAEFIGGLSECIKHDVIRDAAGFLALEKNLADILNLQIDALTNLVSHNVQIKARVVEADPLENGERAHLNFGHTFAHAIERASHHAYSHGQAVALGMVAATRMSVDLGMLDAASADRIIGIITAAGLPTGNANLNPTEVITAMTFDKKVKSSRIRFILADKLGHVVIRDDVPDDFVHRAVQTIVAA